MAEPPKLTCSSLLVASKMIMMKIPLIIRIWNQEHACLRSIGYARKAALAKSVLPLKQSLCLVVVASLKDC